MVEEIYRIMQYILNIYNDVFIQIIIMLFLALIFVGISLFLKKKNENDNKWYAFFAACKRELGQIVMEIIVVFFLTIFLKESFAIDLISMLELKLYWKIVIGLWIVMHFKSAKKIYRSINFYDYLDKVKYGKYIYSTPENIFTDIIEKYNANYALQVERLGILKSLTPVSLIPLMAGYILEGKDIEVNWNWYTVIFFSVLFLYFYNVWKCYKNMRFWKLRILTIQKELREVKCNEKG